MRVAFGTSQQDILDKIDGRMHSPMSGFIERYFGNFQYSHQDSFLEIQAAERVVGRCAVSSTAPTPDNFIPWFSNYVSRGFTGARGSWRISSSNATTEHKSDDDGARLLLTMPASPTSYIQTTWDCVQVIGQFHPNSTNCDQDGLLRLCRSAYQVFTSQPTRFFLHGFYICGSLVVFRVFDRSGLYCSDCFGIQKRTSNIIERHKGGNYIALDYTATPYLGKLYLEGQQIVSREGLWRWARERSEDDELLKITGDECVLGIVSLDYYKEHENTANLRRGLRTGNTEGQPQDLTRSTGGLAEYTEETDNFVQNRVLACIITSPVGRPLRTFQSLLELLQVFRDAIKCHRSLYYDAKILHRDIFSGNMTILDDQDEGNPRGILTDLDSAMELAGGPGKELGIADTRPFMAIGVLKNKSYTDRHELVSFLYVFLWTIITNHAESPPETSKLRQWSSGDWDELAVRKSLGIDQDDFQAILGEFTSEFYSLKK
ncbi:FunK1 protein kinase [Rostrohypoxylon terebratum]|nr:FunK1 protein kinase [Rostrohypoxylon terebratum]